MFLRHLAVLSCVAAALALDVNDPSGTVHSSSPLTLTWETQEGDSTFSIELINDAFNRQYAIANNVDPSLKTLTLTLPPVLAGDGYTIEFVAISDINQVYSSSGSFAVADPISSSVSSSASTTATVTASSVSVSGVTTTIASVSTTTATSPASSGGSVTSSGTATGSGSTTRSGTGTASGSGSAASQSSTGDSAASLSSSTAAGVLAGLLAWLTL